MSLSQISTPFSMCRKRLVVLALILFALSAATVQGTVVTYEEAEQVCQNWMTRVVYDSGSWAGESNPTIIDSKEIFADGLHMGWVFYVEPSGFIVVSRLREMAPVKMYDQISTYDVESQLGLPALMRDIFEHRGNLYVDYYGDLDASQTSKEVRIFSDEHRIQWDEYSLSPSQFINELGKDALTTVGPLFDNEWHQDYPYSKFCPTCDDGNLCPVGCMATSAAQIMWYWKCPWWGVGSHSYYWTGDGSVPGQTLNADYSDPYDWDNMPAEFVWPYTDEMEDAVAELCYEVGVAFEMDYHYDGSGVSPYVIGSIVIPAYVDNFRYSSSINQRFRSSYSTTGWFNLIKLEIDSGRLIQYFITSHALVCDGYQENGSVKEYHLNYGWGDENNTWYVIDSYYCPWGCSPSGESVLRSIQPAPDWDEDGVLNVDDNCPMIPNSTQDDLDSDGAGDVCDNCPYSYNPDQGDADGDGIGDYCETDADDDGIANGEDNCWLTPNGGQTNSDADVYGDECDNCPYTDNPEQYDEDDDGEGDACDGHLHIQSYAEEIPRAYLGVPYSYHFWAVGGDGNYTWEKTSGQPPYGTVVTADSVWGTPGYVPSGQDIDTAFITMQVTDGLDSTDVMAILLIIYRYQDYAPILDEIGNRNVAQGDTLLMTVSATDSNETYPHIYVPSLPMNSICIDNGDGTATFEFSPTYEQIGQHGVTFVATDGYLADTASITINVTEFSYICGDANYSLDVDIDDVVYLIAYIFSGGPAPDPLESGDCNCAGGCDIDDVVYLIAYIFSGGYAPCDTDGNGQPDC